MKYIETLREGERVSSIYLVKTKQTMLTKAGKPYESMVLQDKTGTIDAKIWDPGSMGIDDCSELDYIDIVADVTSFQGQLQLNVKRVRVAQEDEYSPADYLPMSPYDVEDMYSQLLGYVRKVQNPYLKQLLESYFLDETFKKRFQFHSAAKAMHHGFVGGLLQHTLGVTKICDYLADQYPILKRDLLLTAAMFHDVGKLEELSTFPANNYTDEGQLLGHIMIGAEMLGERIRTIDGFPKVLENELKHCILAHHGELEFGSPKKPALSEAVALSMADNLDAKMEMLTESFENVAPGNLEWQGYSRQFESNMRRTSEM